MWLKCLVASAAIKIYFSNFLNFCLARNLDFIVSTSIILIEQEFLKSQQHFTNTSFKADVWLIKINVLAPHHHCNSNVFLLICNIYLYISNIVVVVVILLNVRRKYTYWFSNFRFSSEKTLSQFFKTLTYKFIK